MVDKKVIVVTGGTAGIGAAATRQLSLGNKVIFAARSEDKGAKLEKELRGAGRDATFVRLDQSDLASIRAFVAEVTKLSDRVDVLVLNAGTSVAKLQHVEELCNVEKTLLINQFGPHMVFREMEALLRKSASPRVVVTSSSGSDPDPKRSAWHPKVGEFQLDKAWDASAKRFKTPLLNGSNKYNETRAYCDSKLLNVIWTRYMARTADWVTVVALNPGMTPTSDFPMFRGAFGFFARNVAPLMKLTNTVPEAGAVVSQASLCDNATSGQFYGTRPEVKNSFNFGPAEHNPDADDEKQQDAVWAMGEAIHSAAAAKLPATATTNA